MIVGTLLGSFSSALMLYIHFPDSDKGLEIVFLNGIKAFLFSPFSMTIGLIPTFGSYGWVHGAVALFGMFVGITGLISYFKTSKPWVLTLILLGFALWANNNYLSWSAMMSA